MSYTQPQPAVPTMSGTWWVMVLRGMSAVLFGLAALLWPGLTLFVIFVCFGVYALAWPVGIYALILGIALVVLGFLDRGQHQASESRVR